MGKKTKRFRKKQHTAKICLTNIAKALDECHEHNVQIKLKHGIVMSPYGYVLPHKRHWVVRMLTDLGYKFDDDGEDLFFAFSYCWRFVAATLTDKGEMLYASFGIEKVESTEDGDLLVYGKATDATLDHDQQIIDTVFSAKAISDWMSSGGNLRVQHNPQRDPAGIGVEVHTDENGASWVKALVVEPIAKKLVSKGVLRAYSVGIANPTIERDVTGKARGGIIKGGKIVEISLVDRPANPSCGVQLVKSVGDHLEFTGDLFGDDAAIAKALNATMVKDAPPSTGTAFNNIDEFETPNEIKFDFTPNDLMKILQDKMVARYQGDQALKAIMEEEAAILGKDHREFSQGRRQELAAHGHALSDGSYPIPDKDALRRAAILARSGHGNVSGARALIARRAQELGVTNPLTSDSGKNVEPADNEFAGKEDHDAMPASLNEDVEENSDGPHPIPKPVKPMESKAALPDDVEGGDNDDDDDDVSGKTDTPDVIKDPADGDGKPKKGKKGKKLPPWLNSNDSSCKMDHVHTDKCHTPPDQAAGVTGHDMEAAPVGELQTSPAPDHMKAAASLRYKTLGIDSDLGVLHDLTCPAFHPAEVGKYFPGADVANVIDPDLWQRKALAAATGKSIAEAMEAQQAWQAATVLKTADPAVIYDYRLELNKAFRDANPGPSSGLSPGAINPKTFSRGYITDGRSQLSSGYGSPNSSPQVASGPAHANSFSRPPLGAGHQSPSPSHMKSDFPYPTEQGVPTNITYGEIEREKSRRALSMMHDHLAHMFPSICPILDQDAYRQEQPTPIPATAGLGKSVEPEGEAEVLSDVYKFIRKLEKKVRAGEITEVEARDRLSKRTATRYAESLKKQVDKGLTSRDEVLRALGIDLPKETQKETPVEPVTKAVTVTQPDPAFAGVTPDIMKSMMTEVLKPFEEKIETQNALLATYQEKMDAQARELEDHQSRWDALANQPDPASASHANLALNSLRKPVRPEGVTKAAADERVQAHMMRQLERQWRTSENPAEREAAYAALMKYKGPNE